METKFDYANGIGRQNARMMANRHQSLTIFWNCRRRIQGISGSRASRV